jgi:hypothetical protein
MPAPSWFHAFKRAIYALLALNLALYALFGSANELVDSTAWLVLLVLFEIETAHGESLTPPRRLAIHLVRLAAAAGVLAAAVGYLLEREWLNAANTWLWIGVVLLLEVEVRYPRQVGQRRRLYWSAKGTLYAALGALALTWAWRGEWLDAWDAALWLAAFFAIELNVIERQNGYPAAS